MDYTTLGRTGLRVSRMGLGCGGHSRLGLSVGKTAEEATEVVRASLDLGINFIDTAESYRTEEVVGIGIKSVPRDQVVISTKVGVRPEEADLTPEEFKTRVEACLKRLDTDYIDLMNLHGVSTDEYVYGRDALVPVLQDLKQEGKIRFIGITEQFITDPTHAALDMAVKDDCWDVMMVGFSILNQSARERVFPYTQKDNIGTLCMFAVRRALSRPEALLELMTTLIERGAISGDDIHLPNPLGFVTSNGAAESLQDAAYRYCRWEPGMDVVLVGTSNIRHLKANAESLNRGPLPTWVVDRLNRIFAGVDDVSGN